MGILRALHADGRTIILITHDDRIAHTAQHLVRMIDGTVAEDRYLSPGA